MNDLTQPNTSDAQIVSQEDENILARMERSIDAGVEAQAGHEAPVVDKGAMAREKLTLRRRAYNKVKAVCMTFVGLFFLTIAGLGGYIYWQMTTVHPRYMVDTRSCLFQDNDKGIKITGQREYSYYQRELFGIQFKLKDQVQEKTTINVNSDPQTIIGTTGKDMWYVTVPMAEAGAQVIKPAELITMVQPKKTFSFAYDTFCR